MLPSDIPGYTEEERKEELKVETILLASFYFSIFLHLPPPIPLQHVLSLFLFYFCFLAQGRSVLILHAQIKH